MRNLTRLGGGLAALVLFVATTTEGAEETHLFNGKNLDGWTFHLQGEEPNAVEDPWIVKRKLLICRGVTSGYLIHAKQFENYVLTLELRTMSTEEGNGTAVGSLGRVFINAEATEGAFREPKSIEISLREMGDVYLRDIDQETMRNTDTWAFRAPDSEDDVEREMGQWNQLKVISNGKKLTVIINGTVVNQIEPVNRTKGAVALKSQRGFFPAPTFYRNIVVKSITAADLVDEKKATAKFAKFKAAIAQQKAAEEARRAKEERMQVEAQQTLAKEWANVQVAEDVEFIADVRRLPYPADAREIRFQAMFGMLNFDSPSSLTAVSRFYSAEMAKRGWKVTQTDIEDDEVTVSFQHGKAEVELNLDESSDGVDVKLDCEGLSFDGTDDPAGLVKLGVPQPDSYLVLQREFELPRGYRDQEYDLGERRLFKSTQTLPELYKFLTLQLRQKGYRETRRPIISDDRCYSEFAKGGVEISVNAFVHEIGSRGHFVVRKGLTLRLRRRSLFCNNEEAIPRIAQIEWGPPNPQI